MPPPDCPVVSPWLIFLIKVDAVGLTRCGHCHPSAGGPVSCQKSGWVNHGEWVSKQHSSRLVLQSASGFQPLISALTSQDGGLKAVRWNRPFPPRVAFDRSVFGLYKLPSSNNVLSNLWPSPAIYISPSPKNIPNNLGPPYWVTCSCHSKLWNKYIFPWHRSVTAFNGQFLFNYTHGYIWLWEWRILFSLDWLVLGAWKLCPLDGLFIYHLMPMHNLACTVLKSGAFVVKVMHDRASLFSPNICNSKQRTKGDSP